MEVRTCKGCEAVQNTAKNLTELIHKSDAKATLTIMKQIEKEFSSIVKNFFSDDCGEGERIRQVYQRVNEFTSRFSNITIQDLNHANHLYSEYMSGMCMFISNEIQNNQNPESVKEKVSNFLEKDQTFIDSLFGNGSNANMLENIPIRDSLINLEVLIDFINEFHARTEFVEQMNSQTDGFTNVNEVVADSLMDFYMISNIRYVERLILAVFESFDKTVTVMNTPRHAIPSTTKEVVKPAFQLF